MGFCFIAAPRFTGKEGQRHTERIILEALMERTLKYKRKMEAAETEESRAYAKQKLHESFMILQEFSRQLSGEGETS